MTEELEESAVVDIQFELQAHRVPKDHGLLLLRELSRLLPWLETEELAAVHPIHGADTGDGFLLLNKRAKMVLRVPRQRIDDALVLRGATLHIGDQVLTVGRARIKNLSPYTPLFAHCVTTGSDTEEDFAADIIRMLSEMHISSKFICGRRQILTTAEGRVSGYSLMLHGLPLEESMRVQEQGIGGHRKIGCGIFIPHKSINAVL
jgi:CRISPR-associated protein Cas6